MNKREIAKEVLGRKIATFLQMQKFKDKDELDAETQKITTQIKMQYALQMIDELTAQEALHEIQIRYEQELKEDKYNEWREQVAYFGVDGVMNWRDRMFILQKAEKKTFEIEKQALSLAQWRDRVMSEAKKTTDGEIDTDRTVDMEILQETRKVAGFDSKKEEVFA